jgi:hypothetical protein
MVVWLRIDYLDAELAERDRVEEECGLWIAYDYVELP